MNHDRRSILAALGLAFPWLVPNRWTAQRSAPLIRLHSFEDAVREAFDTASADVAWRRIAVGYSDVLYSGIQGCTNDRPFAGFAANQLRIVTVRGEPGPVVDGVRLYVSTVDLERIENPHTSNRSLDFATLPPAASLTSANDTLLLARNG